MNLLNYLTVTELERYWEAEPKERKEFLKIAYGRSLNYPDPDRNMTLKRKQPDSTRITA